ncbi:MAG: hypothetical protein RIS70_2910, partial [Planctomycetota bacterium]
MRLAGRMCVSWILGIRIATALTGLPGFPGQGGCLLTTCLA